jgi:hypothetical protein
MSFWRSAISAAPPHIEPPAIYHALAKQRVKSEKRAVFL